MSGNRSGSPYTDRQRAQIARAWRDGGTLSLGLLLTKIRPRFTVADYGVAVRVAREELGDTTDYSQEPREMAEAGRELLKRQEESRAERYKTTKEL